MLDEDGNPIEDDKTVVETDDGDAEAIRAAAKAADEAKGKDPKDNKTSDEAAKLLKEVMKLKERLKEKDSALKEVSEKFKDIDLDAARDALKKAEEAENKELEKKGEYERLLTKQREKAEALIEAEKTRAAEMEKKLADAQKAIDELSLGNAFANSKFIQEKLALTPNKTRALYASHFDVEEGKLVAYDKPRGFPDRTKLINATGDGIPFEEAIAEIINNDPDKTYLLKADLKSGAGSRSSNVRADHNDTRPIDPISKIAEGLKNSKNFGPSNMR
jgi:predicted RNase H-like nuclease (RuvC/YqgF family)